MPVRHPIHLSAAGLPPLRGNQESLRDLWEDASGTIWAMTSYHLARLRQGAWEEVPIQNGSSRLPRTWLFSLWGTGTDELWVGGDALVHWDGRTWLRYELEDARHFAPRVYRLWGTAADDVWAAGFCQHTPPRPPLRGPNHGMLLHWDGRAWSRWEAGHWVALPPGTPELERPPPSWTQRLNERLHPRPEVPAPGSALLQLYAVHGTGPREVWWAGNEGLVLRWDGHSLQPRPRPFPAVSMLSAVHVLSPEDVWLCGGANLLHWDGRAFTPVAWREQTGLLSRSGGATLSDIHARAPDDVWVIGGRDDGRALVLHWDGTSWSGVDSPDAGGLYRLLPRRDGSLWAAGQDGRLYLLGESPVGPQPSPAEVAAEPAVQPPGEPRGSLASAPPPHPLISTRGELMEAIAAAPAGATLHLASGTYELTAPVRLLRELTLEGSGARSCTLVVGPHARLHVGGEARVVFSGLTLRHPGPALGHVLELWQGRLELRDCWLEGGEGANMYQAHHSLSYPEQGTLSGPEREQRFAKELAQGGCGLLVSGNAQLTVSRCTFDRQSTAGVVAGGSARVHVEDCTFQGSSFFGLVFLEKASGVVKGNQVLRTRAACIFVLGVACVSVQRNTCVESSFGPGIIIQGGGPGCSVTENLCRGNASGIELQSSRADISLEGNTCEGNSHSGISLSKGFRGTVRGNRCASNQHHGILVLEGSAPLVEQNHCTDNTLGGITFLGGARGLARNNECTSNERCGIYVGERSQPRIADNRCTDNPVGIWIEWWTRPELGSNALSGGKAFRREGLFGHFFRYSAKAPEARWVLVRVGMMLVGVGLFYAGLPSRSLPLLVVGATLGLGGLVSLPPFNKLLNKWLEAGGGEEEDWS